MLANQRGGKPGRKAAKYVEPVPSQEKIARLLGLIAIRDLEQLIDKVALLRAVGFQVPEVASMLGITENYVRVAAHHGRKRAKKAGSKKRKKK